MEKTPKSLRLQIGIFGETNAGKSSFLNRITGQDVSITSEVAGTTTDVVEKAMELLPVGPVMFLDTAGAGDDSVLGGKRGDRTEKIFHRADVAVILCSAHSDRAEETLRRRAQEENLPVIHVINKIDLQEPSPARLAELKQFGPVVTFSAVRHDSAQFEAFRAALIQVLPREFVQPKSILGDLLPAGGHAVFIVPIDLQAPRGRLILPQVQSIRDVLDSDAAVTVVKEREYSWFLNNLKKKPDLVVCDSQVTKKMVADSPPDVNVTTFSTLFARFKGELNRLVEGVATLSQLHDGDRILIAEACSHHAMSDDIGRVKIPRWVKQFSGADIHFDVFSGRDYPQNLQEYRLVIHCGGCMLTGREMVQRMDRAARRGVPVTNYGVTIACVQGCLKRILSPFPAAQLLYEDMCIK
ncbi:MAG: [FeFe] hydrogenase H-cluster maturation GTPase HydF [Fibrobacterota bacterium]